MKILMHHYWTVGVLFSAGLLAGSAQAAPEDVGDVQFARGSVAANANGSIRILNQGSDIYLDDNLQTGERSFAVLDFDQGDRMTVRPNSNVTIASPIPIKLHKGGIKASNTGKGDKPLKINVGDITIKTELASFAVSVCNEDCAKAEREQQVKAESLASVIARVTEVEGSVTAIGNKQDAKPRKLKVGSPIYRLDRLTSEPDSYALLVFRDKGKLTVQQNTVLDIANYHFNDPAQEDAANYSLVKGGLRVLTGAIGRDNKMAFSVTTPVATMGIRGTGFDLLCQGDCVGDTPNQNQGFEKITIGDAEGLYATVWQTAIYQQNEAGSFDLLEGESSYIANLKAKPVPMPVPPPAMQDNPSPRPDKDDDATDGDIDTAELDVEPGDEDLEESTLFATEHVDGTPVGVYVTVYEGDVDLTNGDKTVNIGTKETGYVEIEFTDDGSISGTSDPIRLEEMISFEVEDGYPLPGDFDAGEAQVGEFSLLADSSEIGVSAESEFVCEIQ
jgi:hypothetical protein